MDGRGPVSTQQAVAASHRQSQLGAEAVAVAVATGLWGGRRGPAQRTHLARSQVRRRARVQVLEQVRGPRGVGNDRRACSDQQSARPPISTHSIRTQVDAAVAFIIIT